MLSLYFSVPKCFIPCLTSMMTEREETWVYWYSYSCPCTTSHVSPLGFLPSFIHNLPSVGVRLLDGTITAWHRHREHWTLGIFDSAAAPRPRLALWAHLTMWCPPSESNTHTLTTYMWVLCVCHAEQHVMKDGNQPHPQGEQKSKQVQQRIAPSITQRQAH